MSIREKTDKEGVDKVLLTHNHTRHLLAQGIDKNRLLLDMSVKLFDIYNFIH